MAIELTEDQVNQWVALQTAANGARTWSVEGLTKEEITAKSTTIAAKRAEKMQTEEGRADMTMRITQMFETMDVDKKGSLSHDEFKNVQEMLAPMHIAYVGGHWKMDDATARALFEYKAGIFGTDGRMT